MCFIEGFLIGLINVGNIFYLIVRFIVGVVGEVFIFIDDNVWFYRVWKVNEIFESKII